MAKRNAIDGNNNSIYIYLSYLTINKTNLKNLILKEK